MIAIRIKLDAESFGLNRVRAYKYVYDISRYSSQVFVCIIKCIILKDYMSPRCIHVIAKHNIIMRKHSVVYFQNSVCRCSGKIRSLEIVINRRCGVRK